MSVGGASGGMLQDDSRKKDRQAIKDDDDFYQHPKKDVGRGDEKYAVARSPPADSEDSYDDRSYTSESRSITESDVSSASSNGFYLPQDEVYEIFEALDANGDGEITHAEFIKGLKSNPM